ncbi:MAG: hypothetical protein WKF66_20790 [Pedobacter sp.]
MLQHRGQIVEKVIRRKGTSLTDLAKVMKVNRRTLYNWFKQRNLKQETIVRMGFAMNHDFSVEFPDLLISEDFKVKSPVQLKVDSKGDDWKEKYIDLLERYTSLLTLNQGISTPHYNYSTV